jgi:hypothetical protein
MIRGLVAFAALTLAEGRPGRSVLLTAAATALSDAAHLPAPPPDRAKRYLDAAAQAGEPETRLWNTGLALTADEAKRLALSPL